MLKRGILIAGVLLILLGPVMVKQLVPDEERRLTGVSLEELSYTEIRFRNTRQNIDLAGMLLLPDAEGPYTAVIMIHGSGTSARASGWYTTLASDLLERGIVVLLPDKRGSAKSGGNWRTSSFEDLATDTVAAVDYLKTREDLPIQNIGLVGMSQGGWIAPVAASLSEDIDFIVSFSGATVTPPRQLYYEEVHNLRQMGFLPGITHAIALMSTTYLRHIGQRDFWNGITDFDPMPYWQALGVDGLLVFGSDDSNVPAQESAALIDALQKPGLKVEIFEGSGHALADPVTRGSRIIRRDASKAVADFALAAE